MLCVRRHARDVQLSYDVGAVGVVVARGRSACTAKPERRLCCCCCDPKPRPIQLIHQVRILVYEQFRHSLVRRIAPMCCRRNALKRIVSIKLAVAALVVAAVGVPFFLASLQLGIFIW